MCWQTLRRRNAALVQGSELDLALPGRVDRTNRRLEIPGPMLTGSMHLGRPGYPFAVGSAIAADRWGRMRG